MENQSGFLATMMDFIMTNIAYILLGAGVLYFVFLIAGIVRARRSGEGVVIHFKYLIPFALIIGLAVYCLATGQDLKQFIS